MAQEERRGGVKPRETLNTASSFTCCWLLALMTSFRGGPAEQYTPTAFAVDSTSDVRVMVVAVASILFQELRWWLKTAEATDPSLGLIQVSSG